MKDSLKIEQIKALEVLDSRGNPTIQVEVITEGGFSGVAMVPSGASTGIFEALELRDGEQTRYMGKGVIKAIENIERKIARKLEGKNVYEQVNIDQMLIQLDGTKNKEKLGANTTLGVSLAVAKAAAESLGMGLYHYIGGVNAKKLPNPMMNILNGGKHSDNNLNIQEFMIIPFGEIEFKEKLRVGTEIYHTLKKVLKSKGYTVGIGDEGGYAPYLADEREALNCIMEAIIKAGLNGFSKEETPSDTPSVPTPLPEDSSSDLKELQEEIETLKQENDLLKQQCQEKELIFTCEKEGTYYIELELNDKIYFESGNETE